MMDENVNDTYINIEIWKSFKRNNNNLSIEYWNNGALIEETYYDITIISLDEIIEITKDMGAKLDVGTMKTTIVGFYDVADKIFEWINSILIANKLGG